MKRYSRIGALVAGAGIVIVAGVLAFVASASNPATFEGAPASPQPFIQHAEFADWDVQVHSRDPETWYNLESINAQHGADCSAPPASHPNTSYEGSVFICNNHLMTSINAGGYGVIYLTPDRLLDFSQGGVVQFDMSTERMSLRDWTDIWITPYADNLTLPFTQGDVDLQGVPRTAIHIEMSAFNGGTTFRCNRVDNFVQEEVESFWWETFPHSSATVRDTFRLEVSPTHVKFFSTTMPWTACDTDLAALGWTQGVVQLGHHSYNPAKDNAGVPATWHWDNVSVSPSTPFTIIHADRRYADTGTTVNFDSPAPAGSNVRFSANGIVEINTGSGWVPAQVQPASGSFDRVRDYWHPVPAGTTSIQIRGAATPNGPFFAKDFHVWSRDTAAPTSTATSTTTPAPPISTPTNTPVPPTATATATATATPILGTYRCQRRNPNGTYTTLWIHGPGACP